jgi:hypothetical protein
MTRYSAYIDCPHCHSEVRLKRAERYWTRCRMCGCEFDPSEQSEPVEWQAED